MKIKFKKSYNLKKKIDFSLIKNLEKKSEKLELHRNIFVKRIINACKILKSVRLHSGSSSSKELYACCLRRELLALGFVIVLAVNPFAKIKS